MKRSKISKTKVTDEKENVYSFNESTANRTRARSRQNEGLFDAKIKGKSLLSSTPLNQRFKNANPNRMLDIKVQSMDCSPIMKTSNIKLPTLDDSRIFDENVIVHTSAAEWFFSDEPAKPLKETHIKKKCTRKKKADLKMVNQPQLENIDDHELFIEIVE